MNKAKITAQVIKSLDGVQAKDAQRILSFLKGILPKEGRVKYDDFEFIVIRDKTTSVVFLEQTEATQ